MLRFMIKMWFFTLWDNLFYMIILSVGFALPIGLVILVSGLVAPLGSWLFLLTLVAGVLLVFLYAGVINRFSLGFLRGQLFQFRDFGRHLKDSYKTSLALAVLSLILTVVAINGLQFYSALNNIIGIAAAAFMFWVYVFWLLMTQYWWSLNAQYEQNIRKLIKKCFLLLFDNPGFSLFMFVGAIIITTVSILTAALFPGFAGLLLWFQVGLKLRMYKYDYLETLSQEEKDSRAKIKIPWDSLLAEDKSKIGPRSLRSMFFPWKD